MDSSTTSSGKRWHIALQCVNPGSLNEVFWPNGTFYQKSKGTLCTSLFDFTYWAPFSFQNSNVFVQTDFFLVVKNAVWIFEKSPNFFENFKNPWKIIEEYLFTRIWWWSRFSKILTLKFSPLQWKFWKFLKKFQNGPKKFFRTVN